jgi:hypothetical protein
MKLLGDGRAWKIDGKQMRATVFESRVERNPLYNILYSIML